MRTLLLALSLAIPASLAYTMIPFAGEARDGGLRAAPGPTCLEPALGAESEPEIAPEPQDPKPVIYRKGQLRRV